MDYKSKVAKIYEVMADKTLTFGCMVDIQLRGNNNLEDRFFKTIIIDVEQRFDGTTLYKTRHPLYQIHSDSLQNKKDMGEVIIIGNPIHIGVVLDWMYKQLYYEQEDREEQVLELLGLRNEMGMDKPLPLNPTEEWYDLIDFIISLLDGGND